jgi:hypothetical protein
MTQRVGLADPFSARLRRILPFLLGWPALAFPQQDASVTALVDKAVARSKWSDEQVWNRTGRIRFTYYQLIENLDEDGKAKDRDERRLAVFPIHGIPYARLIEIGGRQLTAEEEENEKRREEDFRRDAEQNPGKHKPRREDRLVVEEIVQKYRFGMEGTETMEGRRTIILSFEPRSRDLPKKSQLDILLNRIRGKAWIDEGTHEVRRIEFEVDGKIKLLWGIVGSFSRVEGTLERKPIEGTELWAPSRFEVYLKGRTGFRSIHRAQTLEWRDYEAVDDVGATVSHDLPLARSRFDVR